MQIATWTQVASRSHQYSGFNLLVGDAGQLGYLNAQEAAPLLLANGEGLVFKDVTQPYEGGRSAKDFSADAIRR